MTNVPRKNFNPNMWLQPFIRVFVAISLIFSVALQNFRNDACSELFIAF